MRLLLIAAAATASFQCAAAFAASVAITQQDFSIGTSATATLPAGWRISVDNTNVRTIGGYAGSGNATNAIAGNGMASNASAAMYNFGAGPEATATDRAVGFLATGSAVKSGNLYYGFTTTDAFTSFGINYSVEAYRTGSNPAGYQFALFYSTNGTSWTTAGSAFTTTFAAAGANAGYTTAPGVTTPVTGTLDVSALNLPANSNFYLAWNYSVPTGTTTTNAWALGIDDVTITGNTPTVSAVPLPLAAPAGLGLLGGIALVRRRVGYIKSL